jgi:hypothetical protein
MRIIKEGQGLRQLVSNGLTFRHPYLHSGRGEASKEKKERRCVCVCGPDVGVVRPPLTSPQRLSQVCDRRIDILFFFCG